LREVHGTPQEFLIGRLCLRAMMQARYQPENEGHFGLASEAYCHFTSPIRRYADIVVHRALKYALGLFPGPLFAGGKLLALADQLNRRERAAMEAEREMARRLAVLLLADRVGEHFDGIVSSVNDFGFFVELAEMPVEGLVRLMDLADDFYAHDPDRQCLLGRNTGRRFSLGQDIRVALAEVSKGRLEICLIPEAQAGFASAARRKKSGSLRSV
jgi:ribonuclease R